jgi:NitT/TauT family transport system ATP-binding protein
MAVVMGIEIEQLTIEYGDFRVIENLSFTVLPGEILTLYGPSGCGKSTIIKALLGQLPFEGKISIGGAPSFLYKKPIGYVPQDNDLLPWKTVHQNVELWHSEQADGELSGLPSDQALALVGLQLAADKKPAELSGGMQRRSILARALATNCELMLFDESFISIERPLRRKILTALRQYIKDRKITCISISHDLEEAVYMSDRIITLTANPTVATADIVNILPTQRDADIFDQRIFIEQTLALVTQSK